MWFAPGNAAQRKTTMATTNLPHVGGKGTTRSRISLLSLLFALFAAGSLPDARAQSGTITSGCQHLSGRANSAPAPDSFPWMEPSLDANYRVELLFAQLTLAEKVDLATGEPCGLYGFFNAPIPRLKIP